MPYKYMNARDRTQGGMRWGKGVTNRAIGDRFKLCADGVIHYYRSKYVAALMDPIQGQYTCSEYIMRICKVEGEEITDGIKYGARVVTTGRKVKPVEYTLEQRVEIAIRVSLLLDQPESYREWAQRWLSGEDRSAHAAGAAWAARSAAGAAYAAKAAYASFVARAAADDAAYAAEVASRAGITEKQIDKICREVTNAI